MVRSTFGGNRYHFIYILSKRSTQLFEEKIRK